MNTVRCVVSKGGKSFEVEAERMPLDGSREELVFPAWLSEDGDPFTLLGVEAGPDVEGLNSN